MVVYLSTQGYTWMREIIAHVLTHGEVAGLVELGLIDLQDLEPAELALEAGFGSIPYRDARWFGSGIPWACVVPTELEPDPTADENGDPVYYDHGVPAPLPEYEPFHPGPEYEPTPEDLEELSHWLHALDEHDQVEAMRRWYATRPSFDEWLRAGGGPRP